MVGQTAGGLVVDRRGWKGWQKPHQFSLKRIKYDNTQAYQTKVRKELLKFICALSVKKWIAVLECFLCARNKLKINLLWLCPEFAAMCSTNPTRHPSPLQPSVMNSNVTWHHVCCSWFHTACSFFCSFREQWFVALWHQTKFATEMVKINQVINTRQLTLTFLVAWRYVGFRNQTMISLMLKSLSTRKVLL